MGTGDIRRLQAHCSPTARLATSSPPVPLILMVNLVLGMMYMHSTRHNHLFTHCPKTFLRNFLGPTSTAGRIISEFWGARILPSVLPGLGSQTVLIWSSCHPQLCCHSLTSGPDPAHWESEGNLLLPAQAGILGRLSSAFQYCLTHFIVLPGPPVFAY